MAGEPYLLLPVSQPLLRKPRDPNSHIQSDDVDFAAPWDKQCATDPFAGKIIMQIASEETGEGEADSADKHSKLHPTR